MVGGRHFAPSDRREPNHGLPLFILALLICAIRFSLKARGLAKTYRTAWRISQSPELYPNPDRGVMDQVVERVALVSAFFPGRARCLEQSLAAWCALRCMGVPAELRIGVKPSKSMAHAWVETDGQPVGVARERIDVFTPVPLQSLIARTGS